MAEGTGGSRSEFQPPPAPAGVHESATPSVGHIKSKVQTEARSLRPCPGFHGSGPASFSLPGSPASPPVSNLLLLWPRSARHHHLSVCKQAITPHPPQSLAASRTPPTWFQQPSAPPAARQPSPRSRRCDALTLHGTHGASGISDKTLKCRKPQGWPRVTLLDSEWLS